MMKEYDSQDIITWIACYLPQLYSSSSWLTWKFPQNDIFMEWKREKKYLEKMTLLLTESGVWQSYLIQPNERWMSLWLLMETAFILSKVVQQNFLASWKRCWAAILFFSEMLAYIRNSCLKRHRIIGKMQKNYGKAYLFFPK